MRVEVSASKYQTVSTLTQEYLFVPAKHKEVYLVYALTKVPSASTLVFTMTCKNARRVAALLNTMGYSAIDLHGQMPQAMRLTALNKFKSGAKTVLVATDVAARGLDIPTVDFVVNFDVPHNGKDYVHRVGRTARAGRSGRALTVVSQYDVDGYQKIEASLGKKLDEFDAPKAVVMSLLDRVVEAGRLTALDERETGGNYALSKFARKSSNKKKKQRRK